MMFKKDLPNKKSLLKELDSLGHSDRIRIVAMLGRKHMKSAEYPEMLASLLEGGVYEAQLAIIGAIATQNTNIIVSALKHPMATIRHQAAGLLAKVASDIEIERELPDLSQECRRKLLRSISFVNRQELAERLLPVVYARWGAAEASILLPACHQETVSKWLTDIGYAVGNWGKLASRHLDVAAAYFRTALEGTPPREKGLVWWRFASAIEALCKGKPDLVLECAMNHGPMGVIHPELRKHLGTLVRVSPDVVYSLLTRQESRSGLLSHGVPEGILKRKKYLSMDQWIEIAKLLADTPVHLAKLLDSIAPSSRKVIFEAVYEEDKRQERIFPERLLQQLPHIVRDQEATRMLGLREIYDNRENTIRITACRSIHHSREPLEQAAYASNADERAMALVQLIKSTALSRKGMDETLVFLGRIKNDQDPVRCAVMTELAGTPASMFTDENVEGLTVLVDSVMEARDTSYATRSATQALAFVIMRFNAGNPGSGIFKFALSTIVKLAKQSGQLTLPSLQDNFPRGIEERLFEEIYPLAAASNRREEYNLLFSLANSFGKRGYGISKLQSLLREAEKAKIAATSARAARYWLASPATRDERVRELLTLDKSFITIYEVFRHIHLKRQEWLDPFISGAAIKGKFLTGKTIYMVPAADGFGRWLPRQQESFRSLMERVASDAKRSLQERSTAIKVMAAMPEFSTDMLAKFLEDENIVIVEAALYAHSLLEEPEKVLLVLMANLDGDRARVAMYSIPRCIRRVNPVVLASVLKELLDRDKLKITVRKEAIRLLGAYRSSDSIAVLMNEIEKPNAHKDVIIAIGHAARQLLDDERAWEILSRMASSSQSDIAKSILFQQPNELPAAYRSRYLELIIKIAGHSDPDTGRLALNSMIRWSNGNEGVIAQATAKVIVDLADSSRWNTAMNTLTEICRDGVVNEQVIGLFKNLASVTISEDWNANAKRDLPHRQRLLKFADKLAALPKNTRVNLVPLYKGIIDCLAPDETLKQPVMKLYAASIDWINVTESVAYLNIIADCASNQRRLLDIAYKQIAQDLKDSRGYWTPEAILEIVEVLWSQGSYEAQWLGLSLLEVAGGELLWSPECTRLLRLYRNHPNVELRSLALNIWTVME